VITLGVDAHKEVHMAAALAENERELSQWRGPNTQRGWEQVYRWACKLGEARQWGIEGAWGYGRRLAQYLVGRGDVVYEINSRWTAMSRRKARKLGKTDKLDARAVAVCVMRKTGTLPQILQEDITTVLNLLSTRRSWGWLPREMRIVRPANEVKGGVARRAETTEGIEFGATPRPSLRLGDLRRSHVLSYRVPGDLQPLGDISQGAPSTPEFLCLLHFPASQHTWSRHLRLVLESEELVRWGVGQFPTGAKWTKTKPASTRLQ
jgi:hypothetical protein